MTTEVTIKNFQSIKNVNFKIDGFTVIVGKNNIGKSAVIRAVDAALGNELGKEFIRKGEKETEVQIKKDALDILWKKGDVSSYVINGETFTKLNRSVPKPLSDAGFEKMQIDDRAVNPLIAHQFEPLFLLDKRGSVITEVLTDLYDMDLISTADDLCQKDIKGQKSLMKTREQDYKALKAELEKFKDFDALKITVEALAKQEKGYNDLQMEVEAIKSYEENLGVLQASVKKLGYISRVIIPDLTETANLHVKVQWLILKVSELKTSAENFKRLKSVNSIVIPSIKDFGALITETSQLKAWDEKVTELTASIEGQKKVLKSIDITALTALKASVDTLSADYGTLQNLETDFLAAAKVAKATRDELKTVNEELEEKLKERAKIKTCPLCLSPLDNK